MTTHFKFGNGNRSQPLCNIPIDLVVNWSTDPTKVDCEECRLCLPSNYEQPKQTMEIVHFLNYETHNGRTGCGQQVGDLVWDFNMSRVTCEDCRPDIRVPPANFEQPKQMKTWKVWFLGSTAKFDADSLTFEDSFVVFRRSDSVYRAFPANVIREIHQIEDME